MNFSAVNFYVTGGTLKRGAACYVERQADAALFEGLMRGEFCYVLTSRQMGKSSLMVQAASRLRQEGVAVAALDLTAIGQNLNPEQWYNGLLTQLGVRLDLEDELDDFAYEHKHISPLQRWVRAIREVVLDKCKGKVAIFVDEIDAVRSLPFSTDEFFAAVREFYNARSEDPELDRLTFCLLGVASPSDLIRDSRTTPFNIGRRIELNDFTQAEAASLSRGLLREENAAKVLLNRILYWTGGHPFLTQRMCRAVAEDGKINCSQDIDELCGKLFFSHRAQERDDNLLFVRERILRSEADLAGLLELYKKVRSHKKVRDDETNPLTAILRLSGIVKTENGLLKPRNRIYETVFNVEWVKTNMPDAELRRQSAAFRRGMLRAALISASIIAVMSGMLVFAVKQRNLADAQRSRAERQESENRKLLYAAQIALAYQAWENGNPDQAENLLEGWLPKPDKEDLRGFEWRYLWRLCHSDLFTLRHRGYVHSTAFSPDGKIVVTAGSDNTAKLWDAASGRELRELKGRANAISSAAFSPDGKTIVTGSEDNTAKLWDAATGRELLELKGHVNGINSAAFSPDGKTIVTGSSDKTAKLWDAATGRELLELKGHANSIRSAAFSPDGKTVLTGSNDKTARLWDAASGRALTVIKGNADVINCAAFSPDGKIIAAGCGDGTVKLWDVASGRETATLRGHTNWVNWVEFSPDGETLVTGSGDKTARLWDAASGRELAVLRGHASTVYCAAFSPDGRTLVTGSDDNTAKLWDVNSAKKWIALKGHTGIVHSLAFSPDGSILATGSADQTVKLWDAVTGERLADLEGHLDAVASVAFSPDGRLLASGSDDKTVRLWDVFTRRNIAVLRGHKAMINSAAFSPDGKILATASSDRTVKLWDLAARRELKTLFGHKDSVYSAAFSPDGKKLVTGGWDKTIKIWDTNVWRETAALNCGAKKVYSAAFSPDGKTAAAFCSEGNNQEIKLWDADAGLEQAHINLESSRLYSSNLIMGYSPDGKRLVAGSGDNGFKLYDADGLMELIAFKGPSRSVNAGAFSPDGNTFAAGGFDNIVRLWRAESSRAESTPKPVLTKANVAPSVPINLDFEQGEADQMPVGWMLHKLSKEDGFIAKQTKTDPSRGEKCAFLGRDEEAAPILKRDASVSPFANLWQVFDASPYRGKRVRFSAAVRMETAEPRAHAQLWLRANDANGKLGFFDNMEDRPITFGKWRRYEIVGDIGKDADRLNIGVILAGEGKVYIDDAKFEIIDKF